MDILSKRNSLVGDGVDVTSAPGSRKGSKGLGSLTVEVVDTSRTHWSNLPYTLCQQQAMLRLATQKAARRVYCASQHVY